MSLEPGQMLSHYRVDRRIGAGGMGEVYQAEDTRLGRRIALKILPAGMSSDPARRARFEREARAVATLNHPNIVTLHSVEEADGVMFLTMELVDGRPLTQLLTSDGLHLGRLLDWSLGVADALVAAHRQGVVHRDLKPDNVMVTTEGRIKVLDFGLAKMRETGAEGSGTSLPTASVTEEGKIIGTVSYMSPEQAEGKPLDHRSDIFSFGVLMYEMATGRRPFQGDTAISTISSILKDTPPPLQEVNTALPAHLGRIVRRCLAKDPDRRYQSTGDLRNELLELKEESASGELTRESTTAADHPSRRAAPAAPGRAVVAGIAVGVIALAAVAVWLWAGRPTGTTTHAPPAPIQMSRATTDGKVREAAISPDGRYVAYVRRDGDTFSLRLRQLATGDEVQVVAARETLASPSFSADGDFLHYVSMGAGRFDGVAHRVSVLGGTPRRIVDAAVTVRASPDGGRLAIVGGTLDQQVVRLVGPDGSAQRDLVVRKGLDHFDSGAEWSSDGRSLAVVSHRYGQPQEIVTIDAATGREQALPIPALRSFVDLVWLPGGSTLLLAGSDRPVVQRASSQIWDFSAEGGLRPLTRDLNSYSDLSLTADGMTVAAVQEESRSGIEVATVRGGVPAEFVELFPISASKAGFDGIAWLPGDRLVHPMLQGDIPQIFVTGLSSRSSRALTAGAPHHRPAASRDGRTLLVARDDGERSNLWLLDPETGREGRLTDGRFDGFQLLGPDGSWAVYSSALETIKLLRIPRTGGAPAEVAQRPAWCLDISADGRDGLCFGLRPSGESEGLIIPLAGGPPRPIAGMPAAVRMAQFGPDGRSITYLISREGSDELWSLPVDGGEPRRLIRFEGKEISHFAWSSDGSRLAIVKVSRSGDVVLLKRAPG